MEIKKSKEASLENKRFAFGLVGLVMVASMVLMAFHFKSSNNYVAESISDDDDKLGHETVYEMVEEEEIEEKMSDMACNLFSFSLEFRLFFFHSKLFSPLCILI